MTAGGLRGIPALYEQLLSELKVGAQRIEVNLYQSQFVLLLKSLSPRWQWRLWRSFINQDAFRQELPFASEILRTLEQWNRGQLEAVRECNAINIRRLSKRILANHLNKLFVGVSGLIGLAVTIRSAFEVDFLALLPAWALSSMPTMAWGLVMAFVLNSIFGYLILYPKLAMLRALDDLLLIAKAYASDSGNNNQADDSPAAPK